jgi:hypothetical protein
MRWRRYAHRVPPKWGRDGGNGIVVPVTTDDTAMREYFDADAAWRALRSIAEASSNFDDRYELLQALMNALEESLTKRY